MEKKKTYKELKAEKYTWVFLFCVCFLGLIFMVIWSEIEFNNLKTQLSECEYELRKSNWNNDTLIFCYECEDTKDITFTQGKHGCWSFNDHGDYINAISVLEDLNCKITK